MSLKKPVTGFMILLLLSLQFMLAQHEVAHIAQDAGYAAAHDHEGGGAPELPGHADDACQFCLSGKVMAHMAALPVVVLPVFAADVIAAPARDARDVAFVSLPFFARGPPVG